MWQRIILRGIFLIVLSLAGIGLQVLSAQDTPTAVPGEPVIDAHIIIDIDGEALVKRNSWATEGQYESIALGDRVGSQDILVPVDGSEITILCADGAVITMVELAGSPQCSGTSEWKPEVGETPRRGNVVQAMLIQPRGRILQAQPAIEWMSVEDAASYTIRVVQNGVAIWETSQIAATSMAYPPDQAALLPGDYTIVIEAFNASNRAIPDSRSSTSISILDAETLSRLNSAISRLDLSKAKGPIQQYVTALLYANIGLYSDAIALLQSALGINVAEGRILPIPLPGADQLNGVARPYIELGNWYQQIDLYDFAESSYRAALQIAREYNQKENLATASQLLAMLATDLRNRYCLLKPAGDFYTEVSDGSRIDEITQELAAITSALTSEPTCDN